MKQKSNDISNTNEMNKMYTILNKASSSSSNREKNQLLSQLRTMALDSFSKFEKIITRNSIREKELASLQKNYDELEKKLNITRMHVDQKFELENRGIKSNKQNIISNITKTEEELKSYEPLERPNLLQEALEREEKNDPHLKPILLWDIEMQRYEELIYILQKRIIAVEENQECSEKIIEEFGSVFGLIDEFKTLTIENQKLKKDETQFLSDEVVKRRNNSDISNIAVRPMILSLQKELQNQYLLLTRLKEKNENSEFECSMNHSESFIKSISLKKNDPINKTILVKQDFDSFCNDPNFSSFEIDSTPEQLFEESKQNIDQAEEQLKKVEDDVNTIRNLEIKIDSSAGSRCQKLFEINHRLLAQIQSLHAKIDDFNVESLLLLTKLKEMMAERNAYQFRISSIFDPYRNLLDDFFILTDQFYRDTQIDKALSSISSILAHDIINENANQQPLFNFIYPQLEEIEKSLRAIDEKEKEKEREKEREREAKKSSRNANQKLDIQTFLNGVQKNSRAHHLHPSSRSPKHRLSISLISSKQPNTVTYNNNNSNSLSKENYSDNNKNNENNNSNNSSIMSSNIITSSENTPTILPMINPEKTITDTETTNETQSPSSSTVKTIFPSIKSTATTPTIKNAEMLSENTPTFLPSIKPTTPLPTTPIKNTEISNEAQHSTTTVLPSIKSSTATTTNSIIKNTDTNKTSTPTILPSIKATTTTTPSNKHTIKFIPLQIPQQENIKHYHTKQTGHKQQQNQHIQQLILQMQQNKLPPVLIASLMTRLTEISGFIFKKKNTSHQEFIALWKAIQSNLIKIVKGQMDGFEIAQHQFFSQVQFSGNKILVKELKNIETMTLPIVKVEIETQYEDQKKKPKKK